MSTYYESSEYEQDYSLSVGQFAKLCGTTRDTLRYYYEQKIIIPRVDPNNGYHYYSASQISSFFFITTMRQAGCSIKEISSIIHNSNRDHVHQLANSKILEMQRELFMINNKISALHLGLWILEKYEAHRNGTPFLDPLPSISVTRTLIKDKASAHHTGDIAKDISAHLSKSPLNRGISNFPAGVTIDKADLFNKNYTYNSIISLSLLPADNVSSFYLPSSKAVSCYHQQNMSDIDLSYQKIVRYIKKNRLKACSDLYIISLINLYDKENRHTYFKYLFICVEDE